MVDYRLSRKAESDLVGIARYSIDTFGIERARTYRDGLIAAFQKLAVNPDLGAVFPLRLNVRRQFYESHAIYYRASGENVVILRILHQSMDTLRHL